MESPKAPIFAAVTKLRQVTEFVKDAEDTFSQARSGPARGGGSAHGLQVVTNLKCLQLVNIKPG